MAGITNEQLIRVNDFPVLHQRFEQKDVAGNLWQIDVIGNADLVREFADRRPLVVSGESLTVNPQDIIQNEWARILAAADGQTQSRTQHGLDPMPILRDGIYQSGIQQPSLRVSTRLINLVIPTPVRVHYEHDPRLTEEYSYTWDDVTLPATDTYVLAYLPAPADGGTFWLRMTGSSAANNGDWRIDINGPGSNPVVEIDDIKGGYWLLEAFRHTGTPSFSIRGDFLLL